MCEQIHEIIQIIHEINEDGCELSFNSYMREIMKRGRGHLNPQLVKDILTEYSQMVTHEQEEK